MFTLATFNKQNGHLCHQYQPGRTSEYMICVANCHFDDGQEMRNLQSAVCKLLYFSIHSFVALYISLYLCIRLKAYRIPPVSLQVTIL